MEKCWGRWSQQLGPLVSTPVETKKKWSQLPLLSSQLDFSIATIKIFRGFAVIKITLSENTLLGLAATAMNFNPENMSLKHSII